ncbi:hypothetical protein PC129_g1039 [Phytophthora cactorum]|uniref:Uncharacterized protein n=1 Tax=Phytophthora cactorum TaxID=29920 RepID=A0A8T1LLW9_9STRA|nr:hypothetical protein Pcac1_g15427 [Phytophthora cactorum]KAG2840765.1 hypothetical protein PC111_g3377 [Phytophthora cactorum]KAG2923811.1 hypothetical protein PC114_g4703 [Phytophthora cactorum]KAG2950572.1 hypothetical protein PC117_g4362 [Phytophthora cactorum]KAG2995183.1 hypothetical protein PC120_g21822 [Phytophthora cactorum]
MQGSPVSTLAPAYLRASVDTIDASVLSIGLKPNMHFVSLEEFYSVQKTLQSCSLQVTLRVSFEFP